MRQIIYSEHESQELFNRGVESVCYVRCMEHRAAPRINDAENGQGECGECIRHQCWSDLLHLLDFAIVAADPKLSGPDTLKVFKDMLLEEGIGTFGVADHIEQEHHASTVERSATSKGKSRNLSTEE